MVWVPLPSHNLQISCLFWSRSSLTLRQLQMVHSKRVCGMNFNCISDIFFGLKILGKYLLTPVWERSRVTVSQKNISKIVFKYVCTLRKEVVSTASVWERSKITNWEQNTFKHIFCVRNLDRCIPTVKITFNSTS